MVKIEWNEHEIDTKDSNRNLHRFTLELSDSEYELLKKHKNEYQGSNEQQLLEDVISDLLWDITTDLG